jgi:hypothetical protein
LILRAFLLGHIFPILTLTVPKKLQQGNVYANSGTSIRRKKRKLKPTEQGCLDFIISGQFLKSILDIEAAHYTTLIGSGTNKEYEKHI